MTEDPEEPWKDCNCMNCRLARIENNVLKIKSMMDNLPAEFKGDPEKALS